LLIIFNIQELACYFYKKCFFIDMEFLDEVQMTLYRILDIIYAQSARSNVKYHGLGTQPI